VFHLQISPFATQSQLIAAVRHHFIHQPELRDLDVIERFLYANYKFQKEIKEKGKQKLWGQG